MRGVAARLPNFHWMLYMDADIVVTNSSWTVEIFVERMGLNGYMALQDGMEVNTGVILFRGGSMASNPNLFAFLDRWWAMGTVLSHAGADTTDQGALMVAVLELVSPQAARACAKKRKYWRLVACWELSMTQLGHPFGARSVGGVRFLHNEVTINQVVPNATSFDPASFPNDHVASYVALCSTLKYTLRAMFPALARPLPPPPTNAARAARGFNSINGVAVDDLAWGLHPSQLWKPGDFSVHVTSSPTLGSTYDQYTRYMRDFPAMVCGRKTSWNVEPACTHKPCVADMWSPAGAFRFISRWDAYVAAIALPDGGGVSDGTGPRWVAPGQPHYYVLFALEVSHEVQVLAKGAPKRIHSYDVFEFTMGPHDDLASRLFDFVSLHSEDWVFYTSMMRVLAADPTALRCSRGVEGRRALLGTVANQSFAVVQAQIRSLYAAHGRTGPVILLQDDHIDWYNWLGDTIVTDSAV